MTTPRKKAPKKSPTRRTPTKAKPKSPWPARMPEELAESVADRLKRSLRYAGINNAEMAERLDLHRNTIGGYVTGKAKMLPVVMRLWAEITGVPLEWLKTGQWPTENV